MAENTHTDQLEQSLSRITDKQLAGTEKYGHLVLTAIGAIIAVALADTLISMPNLPAHLPETMLLMIAIGVAWTACTVMVLMRRPILAEREIALGRVSVTFATLLSLGSMLAHYLPTRHLAVPWFGLLLLAIATALLLRAHARRRSLQTLRSQLEAQLGAR